MNQTTGEVINSSDIKAFIDFDKVAEYRKSMGYYQIVTSELTMDPLEVIDKYHGLTQIEDQFRVMKGDLDTRPDDLYRFMDVDDPDLKLILDAFDIKIPAKLYGRSELKRIKTDTRIFI